MFKLAQCVSFADIANLPRILNEIMDNWLRREMDLSNGYIVEKGDTDAI